MQYTTNYGLTKLELSDSPADITEINDNWETIDEKLKEHADMLDGTTGSIAFTNKENTFTNRQNFLQAFNLINKSVEVGVVPSNDQFIRFDYKDKNEKSFGYFQVARRTTGKREISFRLMKEDAAAITSSSSIELFEQADGTAVATCPTPPTSSDTNEIATTEWVRDRIPELAPEPDLSEYVKSVNSVTPDPETGNVQIEIPDIKTTVLNTFFPVGSIYMDATGKINPNTQFGGTWVKIENRFLYGQGTKAIGATGGAETVTLSIAQMPAHSHGKNNMNITGSMSLRGIGHSRFDTNHTTTSGAFGKSGVSSAEIIQKGGNFNVGLDVLTFKGNQSWSGSTDSKGSGSAHENMPPYLVVVIWKRTA